MQHKLPELPFAKNALEPHMSAETLDFHHGKHHNAYVTKLNEVIPGTKYENMSLEEIILSSEGLVYNQAAQIWNHTFFWNCLAPNAGGAPTGKAADLINAKWGSFDAFKNEFATKALGNFGSGWTWLVLNKNNEAEIVNTSNAVAPMSNGQKALLTLDVWEHAYYIDHRNARAKFVESFWNLVNWNFVNQNIG